MMLHIHKEARIVSAGKLSRKYKEKSSIAEDWKLAAPCGLYCGACVDFLEYKNCGGCDCKSGTGAALEHHSSCDVYKCCGEKNLNGCNDCAELPCSKLIQFCYSPIWTHHFPCIENLKRQRSVGKENWLKEQRETWSNRWYLERWLWLQKKCENKLRTFLKETKET